MEPQETSVNLAKPRFKERKPKANPSNLSDSEWVTLEKLAEGPTSVEDLRSCISEVHTLIEKGAAYLSTTQYLWGLEFSVDLTARGRQILEWRKNDEGKTDSDRPC